MVASEIPGTNVVRSSMSSVVSTTLFCFCCMPPPKPPNPPPPLGIPPPPIFPNPPIPPKPFVLSEESDSYVMSIEPAFRFLNCSATSSLPPVPIAMTSIIVAAPTTIPKLVRITFDLFWDKFSHTNLKISDILTCCPPYFLSLQYRLHSGHPLLQHLSHPKIRL